jgi:U3 small nucleolar RNA-associated protein MPP10
MDDLLELLEGNTGSFLEDTHNASVLRSAISDFQTRFPSQLSKGKNQNTVKKSKRGVSFEDELPEEGEVVDDQRLEKLLDDLHELVEAMEMGGELTPGEINILGSDGEGDAQAFSEEESNDSDDVTEDLDPKEELLRLMEPVEDSDISEFEADEQEDDEESKDGDFDRPPKKNRDLLSEDDSSEGEDLTPFQKQQLKLRGQITELENQQLDTKSWTMLGEVTARSRPINSLLEEHVEFDQSLGLNAGTSRLGPQITEEVTQSLEDMIVNRIKNQAFDDVELRYEVTDPKTRTSTTKDTELQHEKSNKSLAQVYEDEYTRARQAVSTLPEEGSVSKTFTAGVDATSAELQLKIRDRFNNICKSLDALSETIFTKHRVYSIDQSEIVIKSLPIEKVQE